MVMATLAAALLAAASSAPVTVEIVAAGHVETPAEKYRLTASLEVCATSQVEADRQLAAKAAAIDARLGAIGVRPAADNSAPSLATLFGGIRPGLSGNGCGMRALLSVPMAGNDEDKGEKPAEFGATRTFSLDAPTRVAAGKAIAVLKANGAKPGGTAIPMLSDEIGPKRAAKQQALTKARVEADSYAALLGGKAVLTRISERQELGQQSLDFMSQIFRSFAKSGGATDGVATDVTITVEFALEGAR